MFVCICNGYRDSEIRAAAARGERCVHKIYSQLGAAPQCGKCLEVAEEVVAEVGAGSAAALTGPQSPRGEP